MKIGIYTDAHFSKSSSVLTGSSDTSKYSKRLDSLIHSFEYMYDIFHKEDVKMIFNLGDTVSATDLDADTITALSEALSKNETIPEYWLVGNHEKKTNDGSITSIALVDNIDNIRLCDSDSKIMSITENLDVVLCNHTTKSFEESAKSFCDNIEKDHNFLLLTHQCYKETLPFVNESAFSYNEITSSYPNLKRIFNGHIHTAFDDSKYCQIGSLIGNSFNDDYSESFPRFVIYDTDTDNLTFYENPYSYIFMTIDLQDSTDFESTLKDVFCKKNSTSKSKNVLKDYRTLVRFRLLLSQKSNFEEFIDKNNLYELFNVYSYRIIYQNDLAVKSLENSTEIPEAENLNEKLLTFIESQENLPVSKSTMIEFIKNNIL